MLRKMAVKEKVVVVVVVMVMVVAVVAIIVVVVLVVMVMVVAVALVVLMKCIHTILKGDILEKQNLLTAGSAFHQELTLWQPAL
ncbi:hypothetical protein ElyMa_000418500 [Elysia marginata]|uniref:ABC transmembrane type-1 domain-containing protein n=1 Tax=Elysia marginata TaxID=1093978 RepID=A0AAV4FL09_9GAST|nr:hypothetical protein ElyMa_000418500 [Elysia marginata]